MNLWIVLVSTLMALLAYITIWFMIARFMGRVDVVDAAWSLGFVYVGVVSTLLVGTRNWMQWLALLFTSVWGFRLFSHITRRLTRHNEDPRYATYRAKWGKHFWAKAYSNIFLLQAGLLFLVSTPLIAIVTAGHSVLPQLTILGFVVWGFGILFEATADRQLRRFLGSKNKKPGAVMDKGLWRYSRHPNYFGEITTWVGAAAVAVSVGQWWGIIGALVIAVLITKVSGIPPLEKRYANDPAYQTYKKHTSMLIPFPPK